MSSSRLALGLVLACIAPTPASASETDLYRRSLERSIVRAQERLQESTELWEDHSTWENAWRVRSDHYEVRTTQSRHFALDVARGLETMLAHFKRVLASDYEPSEPFNVFIFPGLAEYNTFGEDFGAEHSSFYGSFFPQGNPERAVATMYTENPTLMGMWITHSALHQFLDRAYSRQPPPWVSEGLASYFTLFWDYAYGVSEISRIQRNESVHGDFENAPDAEFIPLRELLSAPIERYVDRTHNRFVELGMLFTYLMAYREDTKTVYEGEAEARAPFAEYLRALLSGRNYAQGDVHELLTAGRGDLEAEFKAFDFGGE